MPDPNLTALRAMVHFVTRKYALEPEKLGSTKLHKIHWWTELRTLQRLNSPAADSNRKTVMKVGFAGLARMGQGMAGRILDDGFSRERIHEMVGRAHDDILGLEGILSDGRKWMAGDQFSLADIAWMPNFHRFDLLRWPLDTYPNLMRWFEIASARSSYGKALDGWEPKALMDKVLPILDERRANNDGIDSYGPLARL